VADAIVAALAARGGVMSQQDLAGHATQVTEPISTTYR
jgi:gamma-glutamyltranspeptidase